MSEQDKALEYWVYQGKFNCEPLLLIYNERQKIKQVAPENFDEFHVIEYKAYEALADENKKLREALEKIASREHTLSARIARDARKKGGGI
jgi:hypothetical protein